MGRYLIKDLEGRLWARTITRKSAVKLLYTLTEKANGKKFLIETE